jgi:hypothetical protein
MSAIGGKADIALTGHKADIERFFRFDRAGTSGSADEPVAAY